MLDIDDFHGHDFKLVVWGRPRAHACRVQLCVIVGNSNHWFKAMPMKPPTRNKNLPCSFPLLYLPHINLNLRKEGESLLQGKAQSVCMFLLCKASYLDVPHHQYMEKLMKMNINQCKYIINLHLVISYHIVLCSAQREVGNKWNSQTQVLYSSWGNWDNPNKVTTTIIFCSDIWCDDAHHGCSSIS